jgi:hypothetical protein
VPASNANNARHDSEQDLSPPQLASFPRIQAVFVSYVELRIALGALLQRTPRLTSLRRSSAVLPATSDCAHGDGTGGSGPQAYASGDRVHGDVKRPIEVCNWCVWSGEGRYGTKDVVE